MNAWVGIQGCIFSSAMLEAEMIGLSVLRVHEHKSEEHAEIASCMHSSCKI